MLPENCSRWQRVVSPEKLFKSPQSCRVRALTYDGPLDLSVPQYNGPIDLLPGEDIPRLEFPTQKELHAFLLAYVRSLFVGEACNDFVPWECADTHLHLFLFGESCASLVLINRPWAVTPKDKVARFDFEDSGGNYYTPELSDDFLTLPQPTEEIRKRYNKPVVSTQALRELLDANPEILRKHLASPQYAESVITATRRVSLLRRLLKNIPEGRIDFFEPPDSCLDWSLFVSMPEPVDGRPHLLASYIAEQENASFLDLLRRVGNGVGTRTRTLKIEDKLTAENLADAYSFIDRWDMRVGTVLMHPAVWHQLTTWSIIDFDIPSGRNLLWGAQLLTSPAVTEKEVWVLAEPEYLGVIQELTPLSQDTFSCERTVTQRLRTFIRSSGLSKIVFDG